MWNVNIKCQCRVYTDTDPISTALKAIDGVAVDVDAYWGQIFVYASVDAETVGKILNCFTGYQVRLEWVRVDYAD